MSDAATNEVEVWGDRATSLIEAMSVMSAPIRAGTLHVFALRKGWESPTRDGVIAYCERRNLIARYRAFDGKEAFRLVGVAPPAEEGPESPPEEDEPQQSAQEEPTVEKEDLTTAQAAKLLGVTPTAVKQALARGSIKAARRGGRGVPTMFRRVDVVAYKAQRAQGKQGVRPSSSTDLLPATTSKRRAAAPRSTAIVPRVVQLRTKAAPAPDVLEDLRLLLRTVERGWLSADDGWAKLRELVSEL